MNKYQEPTDQEKKEILIRQQLAKYDGIDDELWRLWKEIYNTILENKPKEQQ